MRWPYYVVGALALLSGAFAAGRYSPPGPTVKTVTITEVQEQVVNKIVYSKAADRVVTRTIVVERKPDGAERTEVVEREVERSTETTVSDTTSKTEEKRRENKTVTPYRADWHLTAMVGAAGVAWPVPLVYGGGVQRRIAGPFWIGAWGLGGRTQGAGGLSIGVEF